VAVGFFAMGVLGALMSGWLGIMVWGLLAGTAGMVSIRVLRMGVIVGGEQLLHRELLSTLSLFKQDIEDVTVERIDNKVVFDVFAPMLETAQGHVALTALARNRLIGRTGPPPAIVDQAHVIKTWLRGDTTLLP